MLRPDFDSSPFYRSHMRDPRGRGSWAFSFEPSPNNVDRPQPATRRVHRDKP